jgi:hypothetical protein
MPEVTATSDATTVAGGAAAVSVDEVLGLTKDQVCALVDPVVLEDVMGAPPASTTGALPGDVGPSCLFTGTGDIGVQFNRKGPVALISASEALGNQVDDIEVAGRRGAIEQFSPASKRLTVWLGSDTDPALVIYSATTDGAESVAESVLERITG